MPGLLELLATVRHDLSVRMRGMQPQRQQTKTNAQALVARRCAAVGMAIQQCCAALKACTGAAELLVREVAQGYFLNLLVVFLAMLGRLSTLLRHVGTLAFGLYQALEGRIGKAGKEGGREQGIRPRLSMQKFSNVLGLHAVSREEETTVEVASAKRQVKAGQDDDDDDDDDLGVSLGVAAAAASLNLPFHAAPVLSFRTRIIPASTTSSVSNAAAASTTGKTAVASRAMLVSEYSSSSEEEEEEVNDDKAPAKQPHPQSQSSRPLLPTADELKQEEKDISLETTLHFVIDRKPGISSKGNEKLAKEQQNQRPSPQEKVSRAPTVASTGAAKKMKTNKDKQKEMWKANRGSLLDEIDDIFKATVAKKAKKRKIKN